MTFLLDEQPAPMIAASPGAPSWSPPPSLVTHPNSDTIGASEHPSPPTSPLTSTSGEVAYAALRLVDEALPPLPGGGVLMVATCDPTPVSADNTPLLYRGMPVPPQLLGPGTPREPFKFIEQDVKLRH